MRDCGFCGFFSALPALKKANVFWGPSKKHFFRACRASVETRKTRIPAKGFAPAREARTGIRQRRSATASLATDDKPDDAPTQQAKAAPKLILSSEEFARGFVPPDYLWGGILLRGFVYSLSARPATARPRSHCR